MATAETKTTVLLFSFSAVLLLLARAVLLQPPTPPQQRRLRGTLADLLLAALYRGLLDLASRTNMILLCHAILIVILRDAGVLGAPARRSRGASPDATATTAAVAITAAAADTEGAYSAPPRPRACRSVVAWRRRPRDRAAATYDATCRLVERQLVPRGPRPAEAAAPWAAPAVAQAEEPVATKQIVLVENGPRNYLLDDHNRAAVVELEQQPAASATDGKSDFDRRIVVTNDERNTNAEGPGEEMELADDRRIEEFIANQWSKMRQESLQLVRSGSQAITAC